jgi:hypothetical protein
VHTPKFGYSWLAPFRRPQRPHTHKGVNSTERESSLIPQILFYNDLLALVGFFPGGQLIGIAALAPASRDDIRGRNNFTKIKVTSAAGIKETHGRFISGKRMRII